MAVIGAFTPVALTAGEAQRSFTVVDMLISGGVWFGIVWFIGWLVSTSAGQPSNQRGSSSTPARTAKPSIWEIDERDKQPDRGAGESSRKWDYWDGKTRQFSTDGWDFWEGQPRNPRG